MPSRVDRQGSNRGVLQKLSETTAHSEGSVEQERKGRRKKKQEYRKRRIAFTCKQQTVPQAFFFLLFFFLAFVVHLCVCVCEYHSFFRGRSMSELLLFFPSFFF